MKTRDRQLAVLAACDQSNARLKRQHTPGPWEHQQEGHNAAGWPVFVVVGSESAICKIYTYKEGERRGQAEANARLIAAAPDLLAACKAVADSITLNEHAREQARNQAVSAIEKAEAGQ